MKTCPVCENEVQKNWEYCPECSTNLQEKIGNEGYSIDRIKRLWEDKGGDKFYKNVKSIEQLGAMPYSHVTPIRPTLGDFVNIHFSNVKIFSLLLVQPNCARELCDILRLLGYYSADYGLKSTKLSKIVDVISRTRLFWKLIANQEIQKALYAGWEKTNQAILRIESVDEKRQQVTFSIEEEQLCYLTKCPMNFVDLTILGGNLEALCNRKAIGEEKNDGGKRCFTYSLYPKEEEVKYPVPDLGKEDYEKIVEELTDYIINKKPSGRIKLKDETHIAGEQVDAYFIITASEGHRILEKYSGVKVGRKIAEKASLKGLDESLEYLRELLEYHKVGLLQPPETTSDRTILKMNESIYSSGVKNINTKLDIWLSGIIEGTLNQATGQRWQVDEVKCLANGDDYCEFVCKRIK